MYLKRKIYDRLMEWKNDKSHSTLEVNGARQTGKTYIINKFADENFKHKIYINLFDLSGKQFMECYQKATEWVPGSRRPEFHYASGDITKLRIYTLSFEEFLEALDGELCQAWRRLPLPEADDNCPEVYDRLRLAYDQYCQIGGYPKVVEAYLERRDILAARKELVRIIQIFLEESMRYFKDIRKGKGGYCP